MHRIWSVGRESPSGWETCKLCELQPSLHHTAAGGYWWSNVRCGQEASQDGTYQSPASKQHTGLLWRPGRHSGLGSKPLPHRKWIPRMNLHGKRPLKCEHLLKTQATQSNSEQLFFLWENPVDDEMFRGKKKIIHCQKLKGEVIYLFSYLIYPLFVHIAVLYIYVKSLTPWFVHIAVHIIAFIGRAQSIRPHTRNMIQITRAFVTWRHNGIPAYNSHYLHTFVNMQYISVGMHRSE